MTCGNSKDHGRRGDEMRAEAAQGGSGDEGKAVCTCQGGQGEGCTCVMTCCKGALR